jgi:alpha-glucosidase
MADFVKQANAKNIGVILWYNSNGPWNDAPMTPKNKMHEEKVRREEFAKLQKMGVKGVKIDFFGGDKQATMKLYLDIFKDAADFGIMVNCHGATIPRGWQRTYPNLVSMEAVMGMEYNTFDQRNTDQEPQHCCMLPFTRNVIGSMDYTPTVLDPKIRGVRLVTTPAFEIALPVIFESGIQHLGLVPDEIKLISDEVKTYLQNVPTVWDETKLIDGYPAKYVIIARRSGDTWYIAGINGQNEAKEFTVDLSVLGQIGKNRTLITDGPDRTFSTRTITSQKVNVKVQPNGGFVIIAR